MKYFYQVFAVMFFVLIPMLHFCTASDVASESEVFDEETEENGMVPESEAFDEEISTWPYIFG